MVNFTSYKNRFYENKFISPGLIPIVREKYGKKQAFQNYGLLNLSRNLTEIYTISLFSIISIISISHIEEQVW